MDNHTAKELTDILSRYQVNGDDFELILDLMETRTASEIERKTKIYEGRLNRERITAYMKLYKLYNIQESAIREIFCLGAEWIINHIKSKLKGDE